MGGGVDKSIHLLPFLSSETKNSIITVRDYTSLVLQAVDTDDLEGCEFSKKFRAKSSGDMEKLMGCVGH